MVSSKCTQLAILGACVLGVQGAAHTAQLKLVEALANNAVQSGKEIDQTILDELKAVLEDELVSAKGQIVAAHKADRSQTQGIKDVYDAKCKNTFTQRQQDLDDYVSGTTAALESSHHTCRAVDLDADDKAQTKECDEIASINKNIQGTFGAMTPPPGRDGWESFWTTLNSAIDSYEQPQIDGEKECGDAEDDRADQVKICNTQQKGYEDNFCLQRERKNAACSAYDSCYAQQNAALGLAIEDGAGGEATRKVEWEAIHKIECFIKLLLGQIDEKVDQAGLDKCKSMTWDDMPVPADADGLTLPTVELGDKVACDMSSVAVHPCETAFEAKYAGLLEVAECSACAPLEGDGGQLAEDLGYTFKPAVWKSLRNAKAIDGDGALEATSGAGKGSWKSTWADTVDKHHSVRFRLKSGTFDKASTGLDQQIGFNCGLARNDEGNRQFIYEAHKKRFNVYLNGWRVSGENFVMDHTLAPGLRPEGDVTDATFEIRINNDKVEFLRNDKIQYTTPKTAGSCSVHWTASGGAQGMAEVLVGDP